MNNRFSKTEVIEMNKLSYCKIMKDIKYLKPVLKSELNNHYVRLSQRNIESFKEQNKLILYQLHVGKEHYLSHPNFVFLKLITKFRICDHNLEIELGSSI